MRESDLAGAVIDCCASGADLQEPTLKYGRVGSGELNGLDGTVVQVEVTVTPGLPRFEIAGLSLSSRRDSTRRIISALKSNGYRLPPGVVTANLQPGWLPKQGSAYDLPLALAVLQAAGQLTYEVKVAAFGELSLQGQVLPVRGALIRAEQLSDEGFDIILVPRANRVECAFCSAPVRGVNDLAEAVELLRGPVVGGFLQADRSPQNSGFVQAKSADEPPEFKLPGCLELPEAVVKLESQSVYLRALLAAAAGRHHLLMIGSAGCGKTHLAACLAAMLPEVTPEERRKSYAFTEPPACYRICRIPG